MNFNGGRKGHDDTKRKKKAKGHRQKGGGTVTVSRGDLTQQGVVCKEWQRTPQQLILEYTQSQKRLKPLYYKVKPAKEGLFRVRCILPDGKNKAKDLNFSPEQSFDSLDSAKHHAALLALHHVDPLRPFERKLPDPYKQVWLQLVNPSEKPKPMAVATQKKSSELDLWSDSQETPDIEEKSTPVLRPDRTFASYSDLQQAKLTRQAERNKKKQTRDNRDRANPPAQVFMSEKCRELIANALTDPPQEIIQEVKATIDPKQLDELVKMGFQKPMATQALQYAMAHRMEDVFSSALDWLCLNVPEQDLPELFNPQKKQLDVVIMTPALVKRLMRLGFPRLDCFHALELVNRQDNMDDEAIYHKLLEILYQKLYETIGFEKITMSTPPEELEELRNDEIMALEAIYDDQFSLQCKNNVCKLSVNIGPIGTYATDTIVEISYETTSMYPFDCPRVLVLNDEMEPQGIFPVLHQIAQECQRLVAEPMAYEICLWTQTNLEEVHDVNHGRRLFQVEKVQVEPEELPSKKASVRKVKKKNQRQQKPLVSRKPLVHVPLDDAKYKKMLETRRKLPAFQKRQTFLELVENNQVVLISGATGCGKSTQIPQFLLETNPTCNVVCTQPRRIAAVGVATRVADERVERLGGTVGYHIRMQVKASADTRLSFCTTGVLLRRLLNDRELRDVTHILVDEVHERNVDTDFLLTILRDLLPRRPDLTIVLMSATMNSELFSKYFNHCPVLDIPGFTYPVGCHYLEDIFPLLPNFNLSTSARRLNWKKIVQESKLTDPVDIQMKTIDETKTDYMLIANLVQYLTQQTDLGGAILIFMSGVAEIDKTCQALSSQRTQLHILPLHGGLTPVDQAKVFDSAPKGKTKVIVSTNIAETSLTINDVVVVIDRGRLKEMQYDPVNRMSKLQDTWESRAAADQRKGRAGRVQNGYCYRLYSRRTESKAMQAQQTSEIFRVGLEQLCLQVKALGLGSIEGFLNKVIEPPKDASIRAAVVLLREIGALSLKQENLTALGQHLANLPMDVRVGKSLVFGCILQCIDPMLTIAAALSVRNPFYHSVETRDDVAQIKQTLSGGKSDHLVLLRIYEGWRDSTNRKQYCSENFVSYATMQEISSLREQYARELAGIGFLSSSGGSKADGKYGERSSSLNANASEARIIKSALCAGYYANIIRVQYPIQLYYESAQGNVTKQNEAMKIKYFIRDTEQEGDFKQKRVFLHPSSANFKATKFGTPWLMYNELVETSRVFIRECSMVSPYAILLFGGEIEVEHDKQCIVVDGWIRFLAVARIAVLVKCIRAQLDQILSDKIENPALDLSQNPLLHVVSQVLKLDGVL